MIPSEIKQVENYEDFLPFYDWLLQHLGGRQRYILYRINMASSPHPRCDLESNNWIEQNCPEEIIHWEKAIYRILKKAFHNFMPAQHIFLQHRMEHSLCTSRAWFSLLDKFQHRLADDRIRREHQTMNQETQKQENGAPRTTEEAKSHHRVPQTLPMSNETPTPTPLTIHARGLQLEHLAPIHFIKTSVSPAHLQMKRSWWGTAYHAHASKILLSRRWTYILRRRTHRLRTDVRLRLRKKDTTPSYRPSSNKPAATPATVWTRRLMQELNQVTGAIYTNGLITKSTLFVHPLVSIRVQTHQEQEIRIISRYYTTAGELTRHISSHYGTNPLDLYLTEDGKPLKDSDRIKDQQLFLRTRLRGGTPPKKRPSRAQATLDVTKELYTIRQRLQGEQDSDQQALVRKNLQQLRERIWSKQHSLLPEIDRLLLATNGTSITQDDLRKLHHSSTDCGTRPLLQRGLFCQVGCPYTGMGDTCPNQIPPWMRTGVGGPTEVAKGLEQDLAATYLRTTQRVPKDMFLAAFGEASIIRASEPAGKQLETLYERIQRTPSLQKCQYTVKAPTGTPKDHIWIVPQPDKLILLSQKPPTQLVQALSNPSILQGHGHMAQHSCCKRSECQTSTNARLCLIFQASGNDEEDQCMGVGVVSTRTISQGEQIFISYSGDETIEDTWGEVFRCYCCHCQKSCLARGDGPLESKRMGASQPPRH
jgi:hypothetical protein